MIELMFVLSVVLVRCFFLLEHDWYLNGISVAKVPPVLNGASGHPYPLFRHVRWTRKMLSASFLRTHFTTRPALRSVLSPKVTRVLAQHLVVSQNFPSA